MKVTPKAHKRRPTKNQCGITWCVKKKLRFGFLSFSRRQGRKTNKKSYTKSSQAKA